jgi:hypothetical protein
MSASTRSRRSGRLKNPDFSGPLTADSVEKLGSASDAKIHEEFLSILSFDPARNL